MSKKSSPNRRRSIAVTGHATAKTSSRRRAYSIAPGERLSPAAKARRLLAPRKSILKASINLPQSGRPSDATESGTSGSQDDTSNMTQNMDFTEVHGGPRKSLARRVSFAAHTHVRLFHKPSPDSRSPDDSSPAPPKPTPAFVTRADHDENAVPGPSQVQRRSSFRRRSSGVYSEFGERSMDMDLDDTAPMPQDFLTQNHGKAMGSAVDDEWWDDDGEGDSSDMEVTEAIALNIERKRSLSLGGNRTSLGAGPARRRSSIMSTAQRQGEDPVSQQEQPIEEEGESLEHDDEEPTTSSAHTGSSFMSEGSSGEPMEFTIPVLPSMRQPQEPDPIWLQLRAMTHSGNEPYEPPPPESDDDAVMIQPSSGHATYGRQSYEHAESEDDDGGEQDMDLTSAMSRLQQARASLGLGAPTLRPEDNSFSEEERNVRAGQVQEPDHRDDTFSTEDSFGDESADMDNRTINLTQRTSLGTLDSSMDETDVHDAVVRVPITPAVARQPSPPPQPPMQEAHQPAGERPPDLGRSLLGSVFSAPTAGPSNTNTIGAPTARSTTSSIFTPPTAEPLSSSVFAPPKSDALTSSVFSAPTGTDATASKPSSARPRSPSKSPGPATVPKPFNFNLPRVGSPSKIPIPNNGTFHAPHRGTAAFAPPSAPKSPKRPAAELPEASADGPSPAKRPATGRPSMGRSVSFAPAPEEAASTSSEPAAEPASQPTAGGTGNRRTSMVRRPAGYFAQRKSLAPGALPPQASAGLRPRASMGSQPSNAAPLAPLTRTHSDPGLAGRAGGTEGDALYPDLSQLASPSMALRGDSPSLAASRDKGKASERQVAQQTFAEPSPTSASPAAASPKAASPAPPVRVTSASGPGPARDRPITHIEKPQPRIIDVSMVIEDMSIADGNAGVSQAWREGVPEELPQDDDGECKKIYREAEEEALKVTPSLFREFASVDETEQAMLIHQLKLIKANNIGTAKSQWYDWKLQWVEQLYESAAQGFSHLESVRIRINASEDYSSLCNILQDATYLAGVIKEAQDILPALREEYAEVTHLLEQEQADIDEIENSDKDFLNELKATIAEQSTEIEAFRADVSEAKAKLERLDEKLAEIEAQKQEATTAIAQAKHVIHIQKESTSSEVFRLKDELEALCDLHLWRPLKHTANLIEFVYASKYHVSLPCKNYKPVLQQATIMRTKQAKLKERDAFPHFTDLIIRTARSLLTESDEKLEIKQVLERLGDFWSSCAQLRSQLTFLAIKYPLAVESVVDEKDDTYLQATATVMFPSAKGKAFISFLFDRDTYSRWPLSVRSLKSDVQVAYGSLDRQHILSAVLGRLAQVTPADSHGCLLDACIEATEQYEQ
ncbi:hypothetical protein PYCCODRAFT_1052347 [Trametes coccinea BRFM310]|uniref:Spc7 kinetochore protein domain-containing protein n=1 Tax=Trametes coccinea (strain BRFM310) TaxID=1353009 RepID=A0A1Y2J0Z7_TRAC3|nr:hypothetical protein PYCCODRAFT_1052347 [Trametes coccinea BRFM310]